MITLETDKISSSVLIVVFPIIRKAYITLILCNLDHILHTYFQV